VQCQFAGWVFVSEKFEEAILLKSDAEPRRTRTYNPLIIHITGLVPVPNSCRRVVTALSSHRFPIRHN
jgi:hypothetical protein